MAFVARPRGDVVTCSIDTDGWIVGVRAINSDVSTGSELGGVVSGGYIELGRARTRAKISHPSG